MEKSPEELLQLARAYRRPRSTAAYRRSQLEPYADVVRVLSVRGAKPNGIAEWLHEHAGLTISGQAVWQFLRKHKENDHV